MATIIRNRASLTSYICFSNVLSLPSFTQNWAWWAQDRTQQRLCPLQNAFNWNEMLCSERIKTLIAIRNVYHYCSMTDRPKFSYCIRSLWVWIFRSLTDFPFDSTPERSTVHSMRILTKCIKNKNPSGSMNGMKGNGKCIACAQFLCLACVWCWACVAKCCAMITIRWNRNVSVFIHCRWCWFFVARSFISLSGPW